MRWEDEVEQKSFLQIFRRMRWRMRWEDEVEDEVEQYSYFKISFVMMLLYSNPLNRKKMAMLFN